MDKPKTNVNATPPEPQRRNSFGVYEAHEGFVLLQRLRLRAAHFICGGQDKHEGGVPAVHGVVAAIIGVLTLLMDPLCDMVNEEGVGGPSINAMYGAYFSISYKMLRPAPVAEDVSLIGRQDVREPLFGLNQKSNSLNGTRRIHEVEGQDYIGAQIVLQCWVVHAGGR